jgi:hypothetical protein
MLAEEIKSERVSKFNTREHQQEAQNNNSSSSAVG